MPSATNLKNQTTMAKVKLTAKRAKEIRTLLHKFYFQQMSELPESRVACYWQGEMMEALDIVNKAFITIETSLEAIEREWLIAHPKEA